MALSGATKSSRCWVVEGQCVNRSIQDGLLPRPEEDETFVHISTDPYSEDITNYIGTSNT